MIIDCRIFLDQQYKQRRSSGVRPSAYSEVLDKKPLVVPHAVTENLLSTGQSISMASNAPSSTSSKIVDSVAYGTPPGEFTEEELVQAKFYNFGSMTQKRGKFVVTSVIKAHQQLWAVVLYPRGNPKSNESTEHVSVYLRHEDDRNTDKQVKTKWTIEIGSTKQYGVHAFSKGDSQGWHDFARRDDVMRNSKCVDSDGTLVVNVKIRIDQNSILWYPKPLKEDTLYGKKLLESPFGTDLLFLIGEEQEIFRAHKLVLFHQARGLFDIVKDVKEGEDIELPQISSTAFKVLLEFIYTGSLPSFDDGDGAAAVAKDILLAADKFSLVYLKVYVESEIVAKFVNADTAADLLCLADGHSCPLLKETCMDICADTMSQVKLSAGWKEVKESSDLLEELLEYRGSRIGFPTSDKDFDNMDVLMLRENLEASDLDVDGTRDMLIQRLKDHNNNDVADGQLRRPKFRLRRLRPKFRYRGSVRNTGAPHRLQSKPS